MSENVEKYYLFPNGLQPIDISRYLSGNGAQIVQYVARATRTDGKVKGEPIKDLEKAAWFIQDELDRLRAENKAHAEVIMGMQDVRDNAIKSHLGQSFTLEGTNWFGPTDERQLPPGYIIRDSFEFDQPEDNEGYTHFRQVMNPDLTFSYYECNEFGEINPRRKDHSIRTSIWTFPATIVKTKKEN